MKTPIGWRPRAEHILAVMGDEPRLTSYIHNRVEQNFGPCRRYDITRQLELLRKKGVVQKSPSSLYASYLLWTRVSS